MSDRRAAAERPEERSGAVGRHPGRPVPAGRRKGEHPAGLPPFEQVVEEHGAVVLRVCRAVAGPQVADDAWSETFLAALAAYPRLRPDSNVRGWLVTIAHHKSIDRIRARQRAALPVDPLPERPAPDGEPNLPDADLWDALAALPSKQRGAVTYHHVAGLRYADVAELLGTSEAAARRSAADGIAALRTKLGSEARP